MFKKLLKKIKIKITKQKRRHGISAEERLVITLQYVPFFVLFSTLILFNIPTL